MEMAAGLDGRLFTLQQTLDRADGAPTSQAQQMALQLFEQAEAAVRELDTLIGERLAELNSSIAKEALAPVVEG
jgi:DNA-binding ferritin-like protein (Dps family)